jgi:hypothetical protein
MSSINFNAVRSSLGESAFPHETLAACSDAVPSKPVSPAGAPHPQNETLNRTPRSCLGFIVPRQPMG